MCRWVTSFSGDAWLNLDRLDGISVMEQNGACLVTAERRGLPNTILGRFPDKASALKRVRELIGPQDE